MLYSYQINTQYGDGYEKLQTHAFAKTAALAVSQG